MKNNLRKLDVFSIVLGSIIGWGAFMLPGTKFIKTAGVINTTLGLVLGMFCIIIIEKNYKIMMENNKSEGGEFSYVLNKMGVKHGYIVGWFLVLAYLTIVPLNATAFPLVVKKISNGLLEFGYLYTIAGYPVYIGEILVSSLIVLTFAYLNIRGLKKTSKVQNIIIYSLLVIIGIIFIGMLFKADYVSFKINYVDNYKFDIAEIISIFAITPWAFIGFDAIPQLTKEFKFSPKKASIIAIAALVFGTVIYIILNLITALVYSPSEVLNLDWATGSAVETKLGSMFFIMLVIALGAAVWSGINGFFICTSKLIGAIANCKMLPNILGHKNNNGVYKNAIIFISGVSLFAPWFGREVLTWIVDMSSLGATIAYFYVSLIAIKLARKNSAKVYGILGVVISGVFIFILLLPNSAAALSVESYIALGVWILIGFLFYNKFIKPNKLMIESNNEEAV